jgi:trimeric autotransporter adhesin
VRVSCVLALVPCALLFSGCSSVPVTTSSQTTAVQGLSLQGKVHGGQSPVTGATIQLYAVGTTGDASVATPMLTAPVTSDSNGNFSITLLYSCTTAPVTPTTEVYVVATGGNPGLGVGMSNPNISMMAALGRAVRS